MRLPPVFLALTLGCTTTGLPGGPEAPPGRAAPQPSFTPLAPLAIPAAKSPVLVALEQEMARTRAALKEQPAAPHHLAYTVIDTVWTRMEAVDGALVADFSDHTRELATVARVGEPGFDSGHWEKEASPVRWAPLPIDDDASLALRTAVWRDTQRAFRQALATFRKLQARRKKDGPDSTDPDFSAEPAVVHLEPLAALNVDAPAWEARVRRLSARLREKDLKGRVTLAAEVETRWLVTSDGTAVQKVRPVVSISLSAGVDWQDFVARGFGGLPDEARMLAAIDRMAAQSQRFSAAGRAESWQGPVLLEPRAAGIWLHEVLGHRLEGQRQHDDDPARVLARQIGQPIMPAFLTVFDDPLLARLGDQALGGAYLIDDDGVPARRVTLVEDGVLRALLVGRAPVAGFTRSDGHGRWGRFGHAMGRQANLALVPRVAASPQELRDRLLAEARRRGQPYGLVVHEADGLFEAPLNRQPAQFGLRLPRLSRVYVDGRPDEPVIAAVIGGRLMDGISQIIGAGDDYQAVSFGCWGDSGFLPVSAASPSLLFSELRIEPSRHYRDRK
jgi:predicted Zn-dependent protease